MNAFNEILLILHFFGLGFGFVPAIGNFMVMLVMNKSQPQDAPILARVPPQLSLVGKTGLALLWITGIIMIFTRWGGIGNLPTAFWWKLAFVIALTAMVGVIDMTMRRVQRERDMAAAGRLPIFGRIATTLLGIVVILAVVAFN